MSGSCTRPTLGRLRDHQRIARAPATGGILGEDLSRHAIVDIAQSCVLLAFCQQRPFRRCELALKAIEQPADDRALAIVEPRLGRDLS